MGRVKLKEESVKVKAVFISKNSGKKKNSFSKNFQVYIIHKTARKLKCKETS